MSLIDNIKIESLSDAQEILKAAGTEDILDFEKAHKDGDLHPNGKWVWVSSANGGKGDWRTLNGRTHKKHQAANAGGGTSGSAVMSTTGASSKKDNSSTKTTVVSNYASDEEKKIAKRLLDDRKKNKSSKSKKITSSINPTFQKYFSINNSKFTDPKKMSVSKTPQGNWSLSYEGKRISTVAPLTDADKKKLESAGVTFDDTFKPKQKLKTNSETYSHDINGVSVSVSKNKDGSYTLEANGKKVRSDDPSFFKDKLKPRVKKALAKEVGIDISTTSKKTPSTNSLKSPSKVFKKIPAKNSDELYKKTLSYRGGRISAKTKNGLIEGTIQNSTKKDDRVILTIKKDDGSLTKISTSIWGTSKYQAPQPDDSKIKEIKDGKKNVKISSAMGATDWSTLNYLINSGIEIQYQHGLSFRGGSNSSKKIDAEEALEEINKNTTFDASVDGGVLYIHTYSGFDMD